MEILIRLRSRWPDVLGVLILAVTAYLYWYAPHRVEGLQAPAPALVATDLQGVALDPKAYEGRVVVLNFWATWCGFCKAELPDLDGLQNKLGDQGLSVLALSVEQDRQLVQTFWAKKGYSMAVGLAPAALQQAYGGIEMLPTTFVLDKKGVIRNRIQGSVRAGVLEGLVAGYLKE